MGLLWILFLLAALMSLSYRLKALRERGKIDQVKYIGTILTSKTLDLAIVIPCRGIDPEMKSWATTLHSWQHSYPLLKILLVFESRDDSASPFLKPLIPNAQFLYSTDTPRLRASLKCEALSNAIKYLQNIGFSDTAPLIFMDSDGASDATWLSKCLTEIKSHPDAIITSYRYYPSLPAGFQSFNFLQKINYLFAASLASVFSDDLLNGQFQASSRFVWGGVMAAPFLTFQKLGFQTALEKTLIDDCTLTRLAREHGTPIHFSRELMIPSEPPANLSTSTQFIARQLKIIALYMPKAFWIYTGVKTIFSVFLLASIGILFSSGNLNFGIFIYSALCIVLVHFQNRLVPRQDISLKLAKLFLSPLLTPVVTFLAWQAFLTKNQFKWRGVSYIVKSD